MKTWPVIDEAKTRSNDDLAKLRTMATQVLADAPDLIVGVNGSYARREATTGSDLDLFFLYESEQGLDNAVAAKKRLHEAIVKEGFRPPSAGGVFEKPLRVTDLTQNIGGGFDTNETITRRMLLLLEGEWLANETAFRSAREKILSAYVSDDVQQNHICLFLLNDVIRYWRTMCVDYEYKVAHEKPKIIRLTKLRFSRMLLYFGGLISVAETWNLNQSQKKQRLAELFAMPTLDRMISVMGDDAETAIDEYAEFLGALNNEAIRKQLENPQVAGAAETYDLLRAKARQFRESLARLIKKKYSEDHPIHMALIF